MEVIDAQIHVWEANSLERPWDPAYARSRAAFLDYGYAVTIERAIGAMDAIGVSAALVTSLLLYHDISYALAAATSYPERFAVVPQVDLRVPHPERLVEDYAAQPSVVAIRVSFLVEAADEHYRKLADGTYGAVITAVEKAGLPLMLVVSGNIQAAEPVLKAHPDLQVVIDHFGIVQGPHRARPKLPFARLDDLLSLARYPNLAVKFSGAPTLSAEPYPYLDLWPYLHRVVQKFGPNRLMWGSDFSRTRPLHTYADALGYLKHSSELSESDKKLILGGTLRKLVNWPRPLADAE